MPLHLDEFQREEFQGYVENVPPQRDYVLESLMPAKNVFDIKFSYNVINQVYARTASITGFNAGAPLRDKQGLERHFGEVAKVQHGFRVDEEELLRFNRPRTDEERDQAVQYVYDQTDDLINGVRDVEEWLRAQAIYKGAVSYVEPKLDVEIDVTYDIPANNKMTAGVAWSDTANATPLNDLKDMVKQYKAENKGQKPEVIHMSTEKEAQLLENAQIKLQIRGESDNRLITKDDLQNVFSALSLPPYQINDDEVDNGNGTERLLPENRVVMLGSDLGQTMNGVTVENDYQPGIYVVPEIQETNPPRQEVYVGKTVFPALKRPSRIIHLDA